MPLVKAQLNFIADSTALPLIRTSVVGILEKAFRLVKGLGVSLPCSKPLASDGPIDSVF